MTTTTFPAQPAAASAEIVGARRVRSWPVLLLALPAFVAIWSGWVGLGDLTGFGVVHPLPGIWDAARIDTAITLPIGVETYAAYALHVWLSRAVDIRAARFARTSALGSLALGAVGQVAYHLMAAAGMTHAPWPITAAVATLPVAVLGMGAALAHLVADSVTAPAVSVVSVDAVPVEPVAADVPSGEAAESEAPEASVPAVAPEPAPAPVKAPRVPAASPAARKAGRPAGRTTTPAKVTRLRELHPEWTVPQIAAKAGVSVRTARRHLNAPTPAPTAPTGQNEPVSAPEQAAGRVPAAA